MVNPRRQNDGKLPLTLKHGTVEITPNPKRQNKITIKTKKIGRKIKLILNSHLPKRCFNFSF